MGPTFWAASSTSRPGPEPRSRMVSPGFKFSIVFTLPQERTGKVSEPLFNAF